MNYLNILRGGDVIRQTFVEGAIVLGVLADLRFFQLDLLFRWDRVHLVPSVQALDVDYVGP